MCLSNLSTCSNLCRKFSFSEFSTKYCSLLKALVFGVFFSDLPGNKLKYFFSVQNNTISVFQYDSVLCSRLLDYIKNKLFKKTKTINYYVCCLNPRAVLSKVGPPEELGSQLEMQILGPPPRFISSEILEGGAQECLCFKKPSR